MKDDAGFLRDIVANPEDTVARLVYADWLDEQGDRRGEFLRLEVQLRTLKKKDPQRSKIEARLRELREDVDPPWLALLDRTAIENCGLSFSFECPRRWEGLQTTEDETIRFCESCRKEVYFCDSVPRARELAAAGMCVAVDSRLTRKPGDIDPPEPMVMGVLADPEPFPHTEADEDSEGSGNRRSRRRGRRKRGT